MISAKTVLKVLLHTTCSSCRASFKDNLQFSVWSWCYSFEEGGWKGWEGKREREGRWEAQTLLSYLAKKNCSLFDFFSWSLWESHFPAEAHHCSSLLWSVCSHTHTHTQTYREHTLYVCENLINYTQHRYTQTHFLKRTSKSLCDGLWCFFFCYIKWLFCWLNNRKLLLANCWWQEYVNTAV